MKVRVPITADGQIDPRWGRADRVVLAEVADGEIRDWQEFMVGWGTLHDQGTEGAHHARVARFLQDNQVQVIAVHHVGPGMQRMLGSMAIGVVEVRLVQLAARLKVARAAVWPAVSQSLWRKRWTLTCPTWSVSG